MCQPKSKGGKRCAIHHHGTQAAIQTTAVKTQVAVDDVKATFSELNKEGRNLPAPTREEFIGHLEKERFVTEIDPTISERDKKMILKKIEKAKEESTPNGGTFHAWKNLMSETMRRYGSKIRRAAAALGIAGSLLATSGCVAGITPEPGSTESPTPGQTNSVVLYGDVIASGEITDSLGTYTATTISPDDDSYSTLASDVDPALRSAFSDEELLEAQQYVAKFVAEQTTDGTAVDNSGWEQWRQEVGPQYVTGPFAGDLLNPSESTIVYHDSAPNFIRDGAPRFNTNTITVNELKAVNYEGQTYITVNGTAETDYRVTDASGMSWAIQRNPGMSESEIINQIPQLGDGEDNIFGNFLSFSYTLGKKDDGSWGIVGYRNQSSGTFRF